MRKKILIVTVYYTVFIGLSGCSLSPGKVYDAEPFLIFYRCAGISTRNIKDDNVQKSLISSIDCNKKRKARVVPWGTDSYCIVRTNQNKTYLLIFPDFSVPFDNAWYAEVNTLGRFWWVKKWIAKPRNQPMLAVPNEHLKKEP